MKWHFDVVAILSLRSLLQACAGMDTACKRVGCFSFSNQRQRLVAGVYNLARLCSIFQNQTRQGFVSSSFANRRLEGCEIAV